MDYSTDYYSLLELKRSCSDHDISSAYRKFALRYHPDNHQSTTPVNDRPAHFRLISEAYDVLSTPALKAIYDQFGEKGLKVGVKTSRGGTTTPYSFNKNPQEMFNNFFGNSSPFVGFFNAGEEGLLSSTIAKEKKKEKKQDMEIDVEITLEELFKGCVKKQKITREKLSTDGKSTTPEERLLTMDIGPGWKSGTKIRFPSEGNEGPNSIAGDVVFIVKEKNHGRFQRKNNDLIYTARITLLQALSGTTITIQTLDHRILPIAITEVASTDYSHIIKNEGMPYPRDPKKKGNLIIQFQIEFPTGLSVEQKNALKQILQK